MRRKAPVIHGLLRPKLQGGVDLRVLIVAALLFLATPFSPWCLAFAVVTFIVGRILGAKSPYLFDDIAVFLSWRIRSRWRGVFPDEDRRVESSTLAYKKPPLGV